MTITGEKDENGEIIFNIFKGTKGDEKEIFEHLTTVTNFKTDVEIDKFRQMQDIDESCKNAINSALIKYTSKKQAVNKALEGQDAYLLIGTRPLVKVFDGVMIVNEEEILTQIENYPEELMQSAKKFLKHKDDMQNYFDSSSDEEKSNPDNEILGQVAAVASSAHYPSLQKKFTSASAIAAKPSVAKTLTQSSTPIKTFAARFRTKEPSTVEHAPKAKSHATPSARRYDAMAIPATVEHAPQDNLFKGSSNHQRHQSKKLSNAEKLQRSNAEKLYSGIGIQETTKVKQPLQTAAQSAKSKQLLKAYGITPSGSSR